MKILYMITKSNWGGAQRHVFDLATSMKEKGHDVWVAVGGNGLLKEKLENRVTAVSSNLSSIGVQSVQLKTEGIIQLYYNSYNFDSAPALDVSKMKDINIVQ